MAGQTQRRMWPLLQPMLALLAAGMIFGFIAILVTDISRKLELLGATTSANLQWQVAQVEIDYLVLMRTAETTQNETELADLRAVFNAFQSRLAPLRFGRVFEDLRRNPDFAEPLAVLMDTIDAAIPMIDGPDTVLIRSLPRLTASLAEVGSDVRRVTQIGVSHLAGRSDGSRISAAGTLQRLGFLTIALLGLMLALLANTWRLYRTAHENSVVAERSAARMATVVETALDGIVITDRSGLVRDFNRAAEMILGCARDTIVGRHVRDTNIPTDRLTAPRRDVVPQGLARGEDTPDMPDARGDSYVTRMATRLSGECFPLEISVTELRDPHGEDLTVYFLRDVTGRAHAERAIRAARDAALAGDRAKQRLLTVMGQELRPPLNGILATLSLLHATQITQQQAKYLSMIEDACARLLLCADDVLDIAKTQSSSAVGAGRPIDFAAIIQELVADLAPLAARNKTKITVNLPERTRVTGDPIALRRVLMDLVENSVTFTSGGVIDISADRLGCGDVVEFCIADTGIGIDPRDHDRIFDDFQTRDPVDDRVQPGAGRGLGVVQGLVKQMGGEIGLESGPGEGSLFRVLVPLPALPQSQDEATGATADDDARQAGFTPLDVLLLEDNEINRLVVRDMLQDVGFRVTEAADGHAAVEQASRQRFDLILMDISSSDMDCGNAARRIRSGGGPCRDTPIIALTANALLHEASVFRDGGLNETITGPMIRGTLERAVMLAQDLRPRADMAPIVSDMTTDTVPSETGDRIFDPSQLDALRNDVGRDRADALLARFVAEADLVIAGLAGRRTDALVGTLAEIHKLAGSAAMFGTTRLYERLREFDGMGKTGCAADVPARLPELAEIWENTRPVLLAAAATR